MTEPKVDPRWPNRPQHPDFWRMSEALVEMDQRAEQGEDPFAIARVNQASLVYAAQQRAVRAMNIARRLDPTANGANAKAMLMLYIDAFTLGREFERRGGHQEEVRDAGGA